MSALREVSEHYSDTRLPGQPGTVAIAGHHLRGAVRTVNRLRRGQPIVLEMPYGRFVYRVEETRIVVPSATEAQARHLEPTPC